MSFTNSLDGLFELLQEGGISSIVCLTVISPLWGIAVGQTWSYYKSYRNDTTYLKIFVALCMLFNTLQFISVAYYQYSWLIFCRLPSNYLKVTQNTKAVPFAYIHNIFLILIQSFYALRVWLVSQKRKDLCGIIVLLIVLQFALSTVDIVDITIKNNVGATYDHLTRIAQTTSISSGVVCEMFISGSLAYYLKGHGREGPNSAFSKLILYSLNIGIVAGLWVAAGLITWEIGSEPSFVWTVFYDPFGGLYLNCLLVSLNARVKIREELDTGDRVDPISTIMFDMTGRANAQPAEDSVSDDYRMSVLET
ncbi:hypothetical protein M422DRAFT_271103 [Sphaerobolus stellatus SS14]|uniref:DUF6534 domain-containing protein n=1 Tax=Sphaerobolus stellatus (strain SS14) TaxID=990650 RepID=A0A0C9U0Z6_SPHS4|nr:hypothetical protein M422DRAFT_271103 [Sphaerobolus stellatus SS14]